MAIMPSTTYANGMHSNYANHFHQGIGMGIMPSTISDRVTHGHYVSNSKCMASKSPFDHESITLRENIILGFPTKYDSNQSVQLLRIARILKFCMKEV